VVMGTATRTTNNMITKTFFNKGEGGRRKTKKRHSRLFDTFSTQQK